MRIHQMIHHMMHLVLQKTKSLRIWFLLLKEQHKIWYPAPFTWLVPYKANLWQSYSSLFLTVAVQKSFLTVYIYRAALCHLYWSKNPLQGITAAGYLTTNCVVVLRDIILPEFSKSKKLMINGPMFLIQIPIPTLFLDMISYSKFGWIPFFFY